MKAIADVNFWGCFYTGGSTRSDQKRWLYREKRVLSKFSQWDKGRTLGIMSNKEPTEELSKEISGRMCFQPREEQCKSYHLKITLGRDLWVGLVGGWVRTWGRRMGWGTVGGKTGRGSAMKCKGNYLKNMVFSSYLLHVFKAHEHNIEIMSVFIPASYVVKPKASYH